MKPLQGVRIVSIEQFGAAPYGTMLLADLGAEVIKIENAAIGGDPARKTGPYMLGTNDSEYFQAFNINKKSVSVDLRSAEGKAALRELVAGADALMNNLRGDLPAKMGLDYKSMAEVNPAIVCVHVSAYGRDNERASWPGYDYLMQAESGLMHLTGEPDGPPSRLGAPSIIDQTTGLTAAVGLLSAIIQARTTGKGCDVDTCLLDVALHQLGYVATWYLNEGHVSTRQPRSAHYSVAPVQTFPSSDGWLLIMCMTDKFWGELIAAIGRPELGSDPRFLTQASRQANRDALTGIIDGELSRQSNAYWLDKLNGVLPIAPVLDLAQALDSPFLQATDMIHVIAHPAKPGMRVLANPIKINGARLDQAPCSPFGADTAAYVGEVRATEARRFSMKLEGIRVIDLSVFLPGPYLTLAMADHGAEVIKVESPGEGDPARHIGLSDGPSTVFFRNLNRGKKSVVLDLKDAAQREALLSLCETADVFVESFCPGAVDRLGVGYEAVCARNPRIVYCSISAFGQDSEWRSRPAHDLALQAESGLLSMTLGSDGRPAMPGIPTADVLAGLQGLSGVLMALLRREQTGIGDYIDISMHDVTVGGMLNILGPAFAEDRQPIAAHERTTGGAAFYRSYETGDGRYLVLAGQEPKFIHNLLRAFDRSDLVELCLRGPGPHQQPVMDFLAAKFRKKPLAEWQAWLATLDVCYGRVNTLPEAFAHPNLLARGMVCRDETNRRHVGPPIRFRHEPAQPVLREPALGEHTASVFDNSNFGVK